MTKKTEKKKKSHNLLKIILSTAVAVAVVALALIGWHYKDSILGTQVSDEYAGIEPYSYETGSNQMFALTSDGLAVASSTGLQLMNSDGYTVAKSIFQMSTPAVTTSSIGSAAFFDVGGTALRTAFSDGDIITLDTSGEIISAAMGQNGALAVCTQATGYKGLVTVYDSEMNAVYRWYSGTDWLLKAAPSPDGKSMAALCFGSDGTTVHIFTLTSEDERAAAQLDGELFFDLIWLSDSRLCLVGEERLVFISSSGDEVGEYSLGGDYLEDYDVSGGQISLFLSKYLTGGQSRLVALDSGGAELGSVETERSLVSLSRSGTRTLAMYSDGLVLYSEALVEQGEMSDVLGVQKALLRSDGRALLLSAYSAEVESLSKIK